MPPGDEVRLEARPPGLQWWLSLPFIALIRVYQVTLSPLMGGQCRYEPTCSRYALEAYGRFGPLRGSWLTVRRVLRCHPFVRGGYDPVPWEDETPGTGIKGKMGP